MPTKPFSFQECRHSSAQQPGLWSSDDLARFLGCSLRHIFNLRKRGLPHFMVGDLVRFDPGAVMAWLEAHGATAGGIPSDDERARQLADIASSGVEDNAECAIADLDREFPDATS